MTARAIGLRAEAPDAEDPVLSRRSRPPRRPGATIESAVEACVIISAGRKRSPGSATIHGGAKVAMLSAVAADERDDPRPRDAP